MPWHRQGTVTVTKGSTTVIGVNTGFVAGGRAGEEFIGPDGRNYEVINIASDTALSILPAYAGDSASGQGYALVPVQGYPKALADAFNNINTAWGAKLAALGTTGNYDILPVEKGGTGASSTSSALSNLGLKAGANDILVKSLGLRGSPVGYNVQGLYAGWNGNGDGGANLICNRGSGVGGFSLWSVNADNTASGPVMTYSYDGILTAPTKVVTKEISGLTVALSVAQGGTGGGTQPAARTGLGLGAGDAPTFGGVELTGAAYLDFHYNSSAADFTTRIIADSASNITIRSPSSSGLSMGGSFFPNTDGGMNCGTSSNRFASLFAVTGTIQTSDAREKTEVAPMTQAEVSAAMLFAKEIGTYKWLASVDEKGDSARSHIGFTVQRAIAILEDHDLAATDYAFICHDEWPAIERETKEIVRGNIYSVGDLLYTDVPYATFEQYEEFPAFTWEETSREIVTVQEGREAGDRYGFRYDQLALFIARGQEERLARLEALMIPAP